ncbi:MAG: hypothetical protein KIT62_07345 [Cyclobacteriaceae bacterium]|nr:hypothetical protein [Cyclobacteriaceae bacterium]
MKLVEMLEQPQTKAQRDRIVRYVSDQHRFDELMQVLIQGPYRITQRAAWPMSYCVEQQPQLLNPHYSAVSKLLASPSQPDAVKRNLLRALQFVKIPTRYQGRIADCCFAFMTGKEPIAVKAFAMTVLANLAKENQELKNEIIPIIESQLPYGSAGFISRAKRVLKQLR